MKTVVITLVIKSCALHAQDVDITSCFQNFLCCIPCDKQVFIQNTIKILGSHVTITNTKIAQIEKIKSLKKVFYTNILAEL